MPWRCVSGSWLWRFLKLRGKGPQRHPACAPCACCCYCTSAFSSSIKCCRCCLCSHVALIFHLLPPPPPQCTLKAAFVTLAQRLWVHDYSGADSLSAQLQARALSLRKWAATELQAAREDLGCCHLVHEVPRKLPPVVIYGLLLLGFAGAYGAVMRVSAMAQQQKDSVVAGRTRDDSQSY